MMASRQIITRYLKNNENPRHFSSYFRFAELGREKLPIVTLNQSLIGHLATRHG